MIKKTVKKKVAKKKVAKKKAVKKTKPEFSPNGKKRTKPYVKIDAETVERFAATHAPVTEIALVLGCDRATLTNRFSAEIEKGRAEGKMRLRQLQLKAASNGSVAMQIWLGKQLLGQTDKTDITSMGKAMKQQVIKIGGKEVNF